MLKNLISKKSKIVIGLNAGTSADGIDLAAIKINPATKRPAVKFIAGKMVSYPKKLRESVNRAINNSLSIDETIKLDRQLGNFFGEQSRKFIDSLPLKKMKPDLVASHGQTVRHLPGKVSITRKKASGTLQLGHPETIAEQSGLITVADFRQSDIAAGGEGAPITTHAMWLLFGGNNSNRMLVNIGGIANFFLFPKNKGVDKMLAKDCGPGNSLLDLAASKYFGKKYDSSGKLSSRGSISKRLISIMMADDFLKGKFGPSTGRERFGERFLKQVERSAAKIKLNKHDIMASLTELTVLGITKSILPHLKKYKIKEIDLFGGGCNNKFLIKRLKENISEAALFSVDRYNINPDYLEAVCYAIMGAMTLHSIPAGLPVVTGAEGRAICGRIIQPSVKRR